MSKHNKPIRQHHVPKVYLKNFVLKMALLLFLIKLEKEYFPRGLMLLPLKRIFTQWMG